jgi:hypothetical protein
MQGEVFQAATQPIEQPTDQACKLATQLCTKKATTACCDIKTTGRNDWSTQQTAGTKAFASPFVRK